MRTDWSLSIGLYPGMLFGFRTYEHESETFNKVTHVFYLPFVDLALEIMRINNEEENNDEG